MAVCVNGDRPFSSLLNHCGEVVPCNFNDFALVFLSIYFILVAFERGEEWNKKNSERITRERRSITLQVSWGLWKLVFQLIRVFGPNPTVVATYPILDCGFDFSSIYTSLLLIHVLIYPSSLIPMHAFYLDSFKFIYICANALTVVSFPFQVHVYILRFNHLCLCNLGLDHVYV